jgi:hypothetical protein
MPESSGQDRRSPVEAPPASRPERTPAILEEAPETQRLFAVFGPNQRSGYWEPPERIEAVSLFGNVRLDFSDANLYEGVTEVQCLSLFGGIEILVPREVEIDANGTGIFGGFEQRAPKKQSKWLKGLGRRMRGESVGEREPEPAEDVEPPLLRIRGFAIFGGVTVRHR